MNVKKHSDQKKEKAQKELLNAPNLPFLRSNPKELSKALARKNADHHLPKLIKLDNETQKTLKQLVKAKAQVKQLSNNQRNNAELKQQLAWQVKLLNSHYQDVSSKRDAILDLLPNLTPINWPTDNEIIREIGERRSKSALHAKSLAKWIENKGIDELTGLQLRFFRGPLARTKLALITWSLDLLAEQGFEIMLPPSMPSSLITSDNKPATLNKESVKMQQDKLYLNHLLITLVAEQLFLPDQVPVKLTGYLTSYSYQTDNKKIMTCRQNDKVEILSLIEPQNSNQEMQNILACQEDILQRLGLSYRVVQVGTNKLLSCVSTQYDIEVYFAGVGEYVKVAMVSNCTDFVSRRANIRFKTNSAIIYPYSLSGVMLDCELILAALAEQYINEKDRIVLPKILRNYGAPTLLDTG